MLLLLLSVNSVAGILTFWSEAVWLLKEEKEENKPYVYSATMQSSNSQNPVALQWTRAFLDEMFNGKCLPDRRSSLIWTLFSNVTERSWTSNKQVTSWSYQLKLFKLVFTPINTHLRPARNHSYPLKLDFPIGTALLQYREELDTCFIEGHGITAQWTTLLSFFSSHKMARSMWNVKKNTKLSSLPPSKHLLMM